MSTDIDRYITELCQTTIIAKLNYEIWWVYSSKDTRSKYVRTMNRYPMFFKTSIDAHFTALIISLYRLYETRKDSINIPNLLKILKKEKILSDEALASLERIYNDKAKPLWRKVQVLRNKAFGHRAMEDTVEQVFQKAEVAPKELRDLVEVTKKLLNELTYAWDKSVHAFNLRSPEDTLQLLDDLKSMHEH